MPRYDYKCLSCNKIYEITHRITEEPKILCPKDNVICTRQISKNVRFETPVDVEWDKNPSDLTEKSFRQFTKAKKKKYRW